MSEVEALAVAYLAELADPATELLAVADAEATAQRLAEELDQLITRFLVTRVRAAMQALDRRHAAVAAAVLPALAVHLHTFADGLASEPTAGHDGRPAQDQ